MEEEVEGLEVAGEGDEGEEGLEEEVCREGREVEIAKAGLFVLRVENEVGYILEVAGVCRKGVCVCARRCEQEGEIAN